MNIKLPAPAENALSHLQDTVLNPMEEALFKTWAKANQIQKPDAPDDHVDYRGIFRNTGGTILPNGGLKRYADKINSKNKLEGILQERMMERIEKSSDTAADKRDQQFKAERQDVTHKQKMDMEGLKLKRLPAELKMKQHDVQLKKHDIDVKEMDIEKQKVGNEGKHIDMIASLVKPEGGSGGTKQTNGASASK